MAPNDYYDDEELESEEEEVVAAPKKRTKKWKVSCRRECSTAQGEMQRMPKWRPGAENDFMRI